MSLKKCIKNSFRIFLILTALCFLGSCAIFLHSYYLESYFNVHVFHDPRWRIFNFNSRQATEGDIYNVAEIPAVHKVHLVGKRRLRFEFIPPIKASSWKMINVEDGTVNTEGRYPEVQFKDESHAITCKFIPEGIDLMKDIVIRFSFYPTENYHKSGMSWDDNYHKPKSSVPFSLRKAHSIDEWVGLPDEDPEIIEAKRILGNRIDMNAPTLERSEQVFRFIMDEIQNAAGQHTDALQEASPLETYELMSSGKASGFCENTALVYYIFANAAGVKTRLIDIAGKFGPLKLTGHYFCESWSPEEACWYYVDPQSSLANIKNPQGKPLSFLDVKKLCDLETYSSNCTLRKYDRQTHTLITESAEQFLSSSAPYYQDDIVIAYKFGYGRNKSYSKVNDYLTHTTLLYAPFELPKGYLLKYIFLYGFLLSVILTALSGLGIILLRR